MPQEDVPTQKDQIPNAMGQINRALGLFVCFFGAIVLISMFFTETFIGKMTNLTAGVLLVAIGLVMIFRSKPGSTA